MTSLVALFHLRYYLQSTTTTKCVIHTSRRFSFVKCVPFTSISTAHTTSIPTEPQINVLEWFLPLSEKPHRCALNDKLVPWESSPTRQVLRLISSPLYRTKTQTAEDTSAQSQKSTSLTFNFSITFHQALLTQSPCLSSSQSSPCSYSRHDQMNWCNDLQARLFCSDHLIASHTHCCLSCTKTSLLSPHSKHSHWYRINYTNDHSTFLPCRSSHLASAPVHGWYLNEFVESAAIANELYGPLASKMTKYKSPATELTTSYLASS